MASGSWLQNHVSIPAAGTLYNTYTTAKSILASSTATSASVGVTPLPARFFAIGGTYQLDVIGAMSWASGNTMTFNVMISGIAVFTSAAIKVTTTGGTLEPYHLHLLLHCRSEGNGSLATLLGVGWIKGRGVCPAGATAGANYSAGMGVAMLQEATPAAGTGFDSSVSTTFDFQCGMGTNSASNGIRVDDINFVSRDKTAV